MFREAPIRRKLLVVIMVTTATALLLTGVGIVALDGLLFRRAMLRDLTALASIVSDNTTAALQFDDARVANETLSALRARPHMVTACLYNDDGDVFARYQRSPQAPDCPPPAAHDELRTTSAGLVLSRFVMLKGRQVGTLVLLYDMGEVGERTQLYTAVVLLILVFSSVFAFVLSSRLRTLISLPISRLAHAAASISETGDYGIRVARHSNDELGILVDSFNAMLTRIQSRDEEIQQARNSLQTTLASIGDAVISTGTNGNIAFANPVALELLRASAEDVTGRPIDEVFRIVNEYSRAKVESPVARVLREGGIVGLANHTILIAQDGTEIPIDDSAAPIKQGDRMEGVVLVFRDMRERRRAQQDAAYLAAIVESSDDAIAGTSPDGTVQTWNGGAERLYGYKPEEVIGRRINELLPPDRRQEEEEILSQMRAGNPVVHHETVHIRKDGAPVDVSLAVSPIKDKSGQIVGVSHVARDITEQKRTAEQMQQMQKLESLGVLAGGIAHDFNNLLTGILGNASLALDELAPASPARMPIETVISASERAAQLAQQMLAYSGKGRFVLERVDVSARVRETVPLIKASIPSAVELRLNLDDHLPPIEADATQLQQLMMNIIINGAEAIPEGVAGMVAVTTATYRVGPAGAASQGSDTSE